MWVFSPQLLQWFKPRLILSGHTHSGCEVLHDNKYPEISVPSFSWRNRNNPSFILVSANTNFTDFKGSWAHSEEVLLDYAGVLLVTFNLPPLRRRCHPAATPCPSVSYLRRARWSAFTARPAPACCCCSSLTVCGWRACCSASASACWGSTSLCELRYPGRTTFQDRAM